MTQEQEQVFSFLDEKGELEGYTVEEVSHLVDVRNVMNLIDYVFYILLLVLSLIITYYWKDKRIILRLLKCGGISTVSLILLILIFTLFSFNFSFTIFHEIFFPQGNWTFPSDSRLIQTFPLEFFVNFSKNVFVLGLVMGIFFILPSIYHNHVHHCKRN